MLGELYRPRGLALETAMAVLETEETQTYACNMAYGCSNNCRYCYVPIFTRRWTPVCGIRLPKKPPVDLVNHQLKRQRQFHFTLQLGAQQLGVFLCFLTDPFLQQLQIESERLIYLLTIGYKIRVATLSKLSSPMFHNVNIRRGTTVVSIDHDFWRQYEPDTIPPLIRISSLKRYKSKFNDFTWLSMEPYPPSAIHKQRIEDLLEELKFMDLIVFGKWNYDRRARTEEARKEYEDNINILTDFCKSNNIRLHVKSDTLNFVREQNNG